jgi:hypothetical protein
MKKSKRQTIIETELAWVIRDFVIYSPGSKIFRYYIDQVIRVPKDKMEYLESEGYILPIATVSIFPFNIVTKVGKE